MMLPRPSRIVRFTVGQVTGAVGDTFTWLGFMWSGFSEMVDPGEEYQRPHNRHQMPQEALEAEGGSPDAPAV